MLSSITPKFVHIIVSSNTIQSAKSNAFKCLKCPSALSVQVPEVPKGPSSQYLKCPSALLKCLKCFKFKIQSASSTFNYPSDLSALQISKCLSVSSVLRSLVTKKMNEIFSCLAWHSLYFFSKIEKTLNTTCERKRRR